MTTGILRLTLAAVTVFTITACRTAAPPPPPARAPTATVSEGPGRADPTCTPPAAKTLSPKLIAQKTELWCWAASAEMVMDLFSTQVRQCEQANKQFNMTTCCQSPTPRACIRTGWPEFEKYGFDPPQRTSSTALTWEQLTQEIGCHLRPVAFSWKWSGGGGHMMVAYGYQNDLNGRFVRVRDPLPIGSGSTLDISYDAYVEVAGRHTHWDDFFEIKR